MTTIAQIQRRMSAFDTFARGAKDQEDLQKKWHSLFGSTIDKNTATSFAKYYRKMKNRTSSKKQRGGMAPLTYTMTPGANVSVYGRFPVEVGTDPASIRNLDVYFHDALTKDCGNPAQAAAFPHPSSGMGSNQAGGRKSRRANRRRSTKRKMNRKNRKSMRRHRGGNLGTSLAMHPFLSTPPPNVLQMGAHAWSGSPTPLPFPGSPSQHQWQYVNTGTSGMISPGLISPIGTNFTQLAGLDPYQTAS